TSEYCEPPTPRLRTGSGFISSSKVFQRTMLEEPVKTIPPGATGRVLSCCSKAAIVGSQFWACTATREKIPHNTAAETKTPAICRQDRFVITAQHKGEAALLATFDFIEEARREINLARLQAMDLLRFDRELD